MGGTCETCAAANLEWWLDHRCRELVAVDFFSFLKVKVELPVEEE